MSKGQNPYNKLYSQTIVAVYYYFTESEEDLMLSCTKNPAVWGSVMFKIKAVNVVHTGYNNFSLTI